MIIIDLCCAHDHRFEGWFASNEVFESQHAGGLVSCPQCDTRDIRRLPSAPAIRASTNTLPKASNASEQVGRFIAGLRAMANDAEDVGAQFAHEARKIHHGETEDRRIKGQASREELEALIDEGIPVLPVPPSPEDVH